MTLETEASWYTEESRNARPETRRHLWDWVHAYTGIRIPHQAVCPGHSAPFDFFAQQVLERPRQSLWHGPRGSGKSFLSAVDTHITSRFHARHGTRILGGSGAQSLQIYHALRAIVLDGKGPAGNDRDTVLRLLQSKAEYWNGSEVDILTASPTSVRGPHVPSLKLDEVDEIQPDLRESAIGVCMEQHGSKASILMTSTWHKIAGPMAEQIEKGSRWSLPGPHVLRLRGPGAVPRRAQRAEPGEVPGMPDRQVVPRRPRRSSQRSTEGQAVPGSLHHRFVDPEGGCRQRARVELRLPLSQAASGRCLVRRLRGSVARRPRCRVQPEPSGAPGG